MHLLLPSFCCATFWIPDAVVFFFPKCEYTGHKLNTIIIIIIIIIISVVEITYYKYLNYKLQITFKISMWLQITDYFCNVMSKYRLQIISSKFVEITGYRLLQMNII